MASAPVAPSDGQLQIKVVDHGIDPTPESKRVSISWKDIMVKSNVEVTEKVKNLFRKEKKEPRVILNDVHGIVYPTQMLALMGGR